MKFSKHNPHIVKFTPTTSPITFFIIKGETGYWITRNFLLFKPGHFKDSKTVGTIFVLKTSEGQHVWAERGQMFWCFVVFEKAFSSIYRETLWFKYIRTGVNEVTVCCLKTLQKDPNFCMWCVENQLPIIQICPASKTVG
jgi:hypothetical protein